MQKIISFRNGRFKLTLIITALLWKRCRRKWKNELKTICSGMSDYMIAKINMQNSFSVRKYIVKEFYQHWYLSLNVFDIS